MYVLHLQDVDVELSGLCTLGFLPTGWGLPEGRNVQFGYTQMRFVLGNPHNPQQLTTILPRPGTNNSHPRYTQFPILVHRMSNPGTQNVRFRYKGELHIRKQVLRCSGVELHKRVTGFVGQNFHNLWKFLPRRQRVPNSLYSYKQPQNNARSAALPKAKNDGDRLVCANVIRPLLEWITPGINGMRCAPRRVGKTTRTRSVSLDTQSQSAYCQKCYGSPGTQYLGLRGKPVPSLRPNRRCPRNCERRAAIHSCHCLPSGVGRQDCRSDPRARRPAVAQETSTGGVYRWVACKRWLSVIVRSRNRPIRLRRPV